MTKCATKWQSALQNGKVRCKMAKCARSEFTLSEIKNDDGAPFASKKETDEYIVSYYQKLYTKPPDEPDDLSGCIENFLGPSILSHPAIRDSILTLAEKTKLESGLTLFELDEAVKKSNKKSAAGIDGLSGKFISKFW